MRMTIALIGIAALSLISAANATPGRLDGKGCHNSKKAGYHCHKPQATAAAASKSTQKKAAAAPAAPASAASKPRQ